MIETRTPFCTQYSRTNNLFSSNCTNCLNRFGWSVNTVVYVYPICYIVIILLLLMATAAMSSGGLNIACCQKQSSAITNDCLLLQMAVCFYNRSSAAIHYLSAINGRLLLQIIRLLLQLICLLQQLVVCSHK